MSGYFLFRDQVLVDKYCDPNGLGAWRLHNLGQPGDILICDRPTKLSAYHWKNKKGYSPAWTHILLTDEERQFWKALILLFI